MMIEKTQRMKIRNADGIYSMEGAFPIGPGQCELRTSDLSSYVFVTLTDAPGIDVYFATLMSENPERLTAAYKDFVAKTGAEEIVSHE